MAEDQSNTGGAGFAPSHLRRHLLDAGVTVMWTSREMARRSSLSKDTWARMMRPIPAGERGHRWGIDVLQEVHDTLRRVGSTRVPSVEQLERAVIADLGYTQAVTGDDLPEVLARARGLSLANLLRLNQEIALLLASEQPVEAPPPKSAARTDRER